MINADARRQARGRANFKDFALINLRSGSAQWLRAGRKLIKRTAKWLRNNGARRIQTNLKKGGKYITNYIRARARFYFLRTARARGAKQGIDTHLAHEFARFSGLAYMIARDFYLGRSLPRGRARGRKKKSNRFWLRNQFELIKSACSQMAPPSPAP